ncbi:hypothetical protein COY16_02295 [Candidatus Roizmanbacteria bacterium CG_4_10_14_0_2_um_filter_39_13]|uniref:Uncharacterized protein n=1 Tax=Candidatus Roizmanbacteria bacterium CG_4_10_14_0_2_um_filter_39_13 TaxID=1974825 RepID=A0A2M7TZT1_9BACT|nr:MAG: hypothetical protein COY16_02295 [Candidatus Roizmanbacteria bacterium CG_4_10_14_0_2_um_filter_39_13]
MKRRINLFSQRIDNQTAKRYLRTGQRVTYGVLLFGVIALMVLFGTYIFLNKNLADLKTKKNTYERYILTNQSFNQDIQNFVQKFSLLKTYIKTDANGYSYYRALISILEPAGIADNIDTFSIDNNQDLDYSIKVSTYEEGIQVLEFFERPDVLEHFNSLTLESFNITQNEVEYTMTFNGVMKSRK